MKSTSCISNKMPFQKVKFVMFWLLKGEIEINVIIYAPPQKTSRLEASSLPFPFGRSHLLFSVASELSSFLRFSAYPLNRDVLMTYSSKQLDLNGGRRAAIN